MKSIMVKWAGECARCGATLPEGTDAMYEKSMGIFCPGHEPVTADEIREYRTRKAQKRVDRLEAKAERLEGQANDRMALFNHFRGDWAFATQPGHIPIRARALRGYEKGMELLKEANGARQLAGGVMREKIRVAGDAERRRQIMRERLDMMIHKGSRVHDACFGPGEVIGVYAKSYRIKFDRGFTYSRDKTYVYLIAQEEEAKNEG